MYDFISISSLTVFIYGLFGVIVVFLGAVGGLSYALSLFKSLD